MNWEHCDVVDRVEGKLGGAWRFRETRVRLYLFSRIWTKAQPLTNFWNGSRP